MLRKPKTAPPKSAGLKLSPTYTAMLGQPRQCKSCGETKEITYQTFAPNKKAPDGVSQTCRKCQGQGARKKQMEAGVGQPKRGEPLVAPDKPLGWPDPKSARKAYWRKVSDLTDRLYELGAKQTVSKELDDVCAELNKVTRLYGDPAGGGQQTDPEIAFRTFAYVIARRISNWTGFGEIHDVDIIPALLDPADQVLILASRNSGKSTLTEIYAAWLLHRDPMDIIGVVSGSTRRAKRTLRTVRLYIDQCPILWPLRPNDSCLDAADQFVTPQANGRLGAAVSFSSFGIASSLTGHRWNKVILDDIEGKDARSLVMQETLDLLSSEVWNVLNPGGRVLALGTPQVAGRSIYGKWGASGEWSLYKALLFEELPADHGTSKKTQLRSRWPARWPDKDLEQKRRSLPEREWDLHWRISLEALDEDDRPLKLRDFITVAANPMAAAFPTIVKPGGPRIDHLETGQADPDDYFRCPASVSKDTSRYIATCAAVDPASGMQGRDECGVAIVSVTTQGLAVVRCIAGVRGRSAQETLTKVAALVHSFLPTKIVCEARADSLYPAQLGSVLARRGYPALVEPIQSGSKKGERIIDSIGVPLADNRVVLLEAVVSGHDALETIKQITHVTTDGRALKHDDRVDALAWALASVAPMLTADEADTLLMTSQQRLEEFTRLPIRKGGIREDGLEARALEINEDEERLQMRLDNALAMQAEELRNGIVDTRFSKYIESLQYELGKIRRVLVN